MAGAVTIDTRVAVARVEVDLGDPDAAVKLGGPGALVLTGADRFLGKPVALQVADGTLHLAAPLRIEVAAPRFGAHAGGTLIVATPHVRAVADDLKLAVSQTGVLALRTDSWSPGFDLDVATSRTLGLGPHVIDYGGRGAPTPRLLAFRSFKEHDGDELLIRGFRPGDQLRFEEDPHESTDPGKELRLHAVRFAGAAHGGAARVERSGRFFYLLPEDRRFTVPAAESDRTQTESARDGRCRSARPVPIAEDGARRRRDLASRRKVAGGHRRRPPTLSVAVSEWGRLVAAALALPDGAIGAISPSLLAPASGAILLVHQALLPAGGTAVAARPARPGTRGSVDAWLLGPALRLAERPARARAAAACCCFGRL